MRPSLLHSLHVFRAVRRNSCSDLHDNKLPRSIRRFDKTYAAHRNIWKVILIRRILIRPTEKKTREHCTLCSLTTSQSLVFTFEPKTVNSVDCFLYWLTRPGTDTETGLLVVDFIRDERRVNYWRMSSLKLIWWWSKQRLYCYTHNCVHRRATKQTWRK